MAATYDTSLSTSTDWVRMLVPDTDVPSNAEFTDEEISASVTEQVNTFGHGADCAKYFAAASFVRILISKYGQTGRGVNVKTVDGLKIEFGGRQSVFENLATRANDLESRGRECERSARANQPYFFKVAGRTRTGEA